MFVSLNRLFVLAVPARRTSAKRRLAYLLTPVILFCTSAATFASIIDDKSDFVGDYTVIDFETRGDGTPLVFNEGGWGTLCPLEYAPLGVAITSSINPAGDPWATIGNILSEQFDVAQTMAGSPTNVIAAVSPIHVDRFLRVDFTMPVNAVGFTVINSVGYGLPQLHVYDASDTPIASIDFEGTLIDGTVFGEDFGESFDIAFGFMGLFTEESQISYAVIAANGTSFDDFHFGVIPEPATITLLAFGTTLLLSRRRGRRSRKSLSARIIPLMLAVAGT